jgi:hypothetical protein
MFSNIPASTFDGLGGFGIRSSFCDRRPLFRKRRVRSQWRMILHQDKRRQENREWAQEVQRYLWIKIKYLSTKYGTFGKGFLASKGSAKQTGTTILAVNLVINLTLFSRSLVVGSFLDTREGSVEPKYIHSFEIRACSGWIQHWRNKTMSCVPLWLHSSTLGCEPIVAWFLYLQHQKEGHPRMSALLGLWLDQRKPVRTHQF